MSHRLCKRPELYGLSLMLLVAAIAFVYAVDNVTAYSQTRITEENHVSQVLLDACNNYGYTLDNIERTSFPSSMEETAVFYGHALPPRLIPVYDTMKEGALAGALETPLPIAITREEAAQCWSALKVDCPDTLFAKPPLMLLGGEEPVPVTAILWDNRLPDDIAEKASDIVDSMAEDIALKAMQQPGNDYSKATIICREVAARVTYDKDITWANLPYGAALGRANCEGQSRLALTALRKAGVKATAVVGMASTNGTTATCHEWIAVFGSDGECLWYDPTWLGKEKLVLLCPSKWLGMDPEKCGNTHVAFCEELFL